VGTEPSYQHTEGLISYDRGIQFWFMQEAKRRNPQIIIAALEWSAPSWVGSTTPEYGCPGWAGCAFFTDKNIDYILGWLHGATNVWHIDRIDYLGVWNEPPIPYIPPAWLIQLRERLDHAGYSSTQLVAPDASSTGSQVLKLLDDMLNVSKLADAVDVIGTYSLDDC
jgi:galactosylceramidase